MSHTRHFRLSNQKDALIADILSPSLSGHKWNLTFSKDLYDWEVDTLGPLISSLEGVFISFIFSNKKIWILESSGLFSCKFLFQSVDF